MPLKSALPEDVNYDEVQSCYISGMSKTPAREPEAQQDMLQPSGTPVVAEAEQENENWPSKEAKRSVGTAGLPPRVPSNMASIVVQNPFNGSEQTGGGVPLPQITPTRHVLKNSQVSRPSEKYWANFSYVSSERRELERMIGYNRSSQMSQPKL